MVDSELDFVGHGEGAPDAKTAQDLILPGSDPTERKKNNG